MGAVRPCCIALALLAVAAADYPSHLYALTSDGEVIWKAQAGGCYVDLDVGQVDGQTIIAAVDFFGGVDLFTSAGERTRPIRELAASEETVPVSQPMTVALGDLDGDDEVASGSRSFDVEVGAGLFRMFDVWVDEE